MAHTAEELQEGARNGNPESMGILGEAYLHGNKGLTVDYEQAYRWSKKAADAGCVRAFTTLGILYMEGWHVARDDGAALSFFNKAAKAGDMKSPRYIGILYRDGRVPCDSREKKALECFTLGAERGDITSQYYLGEMYEKGIGVAKDMNEALRWYRKSAERGDKISKPAMDALARLGK